MAYVGLEPKSSHTIKYSQPFELVLFHVIALRIKCLKDFYYPHLLNNYLINYLIFLGLTNAGNTEVPNFQDLLVEVHVHGNTKRKTEVPVKQGGGKYVK